MQSYFYYYTHDSFLVLANMFQRDARLRMFLSWSLSSSEIFFLDFSSKLFKYKFILRIYQPFKVSSGVSHVHLSCWCIFWVLLFDLFSLSFFWEFLAGDFCDLFFLSLGFSFSSGSSLILQSFVSIFRTSKSRTSSSAQSKSALFKIFNLFLDWKFFHYFKSVPRRCHTNLFFPKTFFSVLHEEALRISLEKYPTRCNQYHKWYIIFRIAKFLNYLQI